MSFISDQAETITKNLSGIKLSVHLLLNMIEEVQNPDKVSLFMKALRKSGMIHFYESSVLNPKTHYNKFCDK